MAVFRSYYNLSDRIVSILSMKGFIRKQAFRGKVSRASHNPHSCCAMGNAISPHQRLNGCAISHSLQFCTYYPLLDSYDASNFTALHEDFVGKEDKPFKDVKFFYDQSTELKNLDKNELQITTRKFNLRGLNASMLEKYNVRISKDGNSLLLPLTRLDERIIAVQFVTYKEDSSGESLEESVFPRVDEATYFGFPQVGAQDASYRCIVLTSNPLDVLAVNQEVNVTALSFPNDVKKIPLEIMPLLEKFEKVILWVSNSNADWRLLLARKLGKKSYFVRQQENISGPLICMQNRLNLRHILNQAICLTHKMTPLTFETLEELSFEPPEKHQGIKWKRFSLLNEILKGHRRGELTVFSGHTGIGKTTFMSEYSLDLCMQGVRTLWASFEISNVRLYETMMTQFALCPLKKNTEEFHYWKSQFRELKLFFMNLHGQQNSVESVFEAMIHAVITYGVQHVVVDNLQFMMNVYDSNASIDIYRVQDKVFSEFRNFATQYSCHVTLVIHPKKEPEFTELNNNSISGNAKGKQEADNILILQTTRQRQYIQVTKNRFDGTRGSFFLDYNKDTRSFSLKKKTANSNPLD